MIEKLKSVVGFQLYEDQCNGKIEEILDIFIEWLENREVDRNEVRHRSVNEVIPELYREKNNINQNYNQ